MYKKIQIEIERIERTVDIIDALSNDNQTYSSSSELAGISLLLKNAIDRLNAVSINNATLEDIIRYDPYDLLEAVQHEAVWYEPSKILRRP